MGDGAKTSSKTGNSRIENITKAGNLVNLTNVENTTEIKSEREDLVDFLVGYMNCPLCGRNFHFDTLFDHVREFHSDNFNNEFVTGGIGETLSMSKTTPAEEKRYDCDKDGCPAAFKSKYMLTRHQLTHSGEKPYQCDICSSRFSQKPHLVAHKRTHTGERPYKCELCPYTSARRSNLRVHHQSQHVASSENPTVRTQARRFQCNTCSSTFTRKEYLVQHIRIHTGEKPFKCQICSSAFKQRGQLFEHHRTHTGFKPFKCEKCPAAFPRKALLAKHCCPVSQYML